MTLKYYIQHCFWGFFLAGMTYFDHFYRPVSNADPVIEQAILYLALPSGILYPFAFYVVESLALKFMKPDTWETTHSRPGVTRFASVIMIVFCGFFAIPLALFFPLVYRRREAKMDEAQPVTKTPKTKPPSKKKTAR